MKEAYIVMGSHSWAKDWLYMRAFEIWLDHVNIGGFYFSEKVIVAKITHDQDFDEKAYYVDEAGAINYPKGAKCEIKHFEICKIKAQKYDHLKDETEGAMYDLAEPYDKAVCSFN